jgi:hypothetical protein
MPTLKNPSPNAIEALRLYKSSIALCFPSAAERAEALGISETAIRKWDRGELRFVKKSSSERAHLVYQTCRKLTPSFSRKKDIGAYLLHAIYEVDRRIRPLDLVVETRDPEVAIELLAATRGATVDVVKKKLPAAAFSNSAWAGVLATTSDDERDLEEELLERVDEHGVTLAL